MTGDAEEVRVLTVHECFELLRGGEVGRLAISRPAHPEVFPVNYAVDHGTVVFRTAPGTKLDALLLERDVTFEVDGYERERGDAWSVIVKGRAERVEAAHERFDAVDLPLFPWQTGPKPQFVRVVPVEVTGRRFHAVRRRPGTAQIDVSARRTRDE